MSKGLVEMLCGLSVVLLAFPLWAKDLEVKVGEPVLVTSTREADGYMARFPTIAKLATGEVACFFGSTRDAEQPEGNFGGWCVSTDGGKTWGPRVNRMLSSSSHIQLDDGRLLKLDYHTLTAKKDDPRNFVTWAHWFSDGFRKVESRLVNIRLDRDYILDWSKFDPHPENFPLEKLKYQVGPYINGSIVKANDGSLLASAYGVFDYREHEGYPAGQGPWNKVAFRNFLLQSRDGGLNWEYYSTIKTWEDLKLDPSNPAERPEKTWTGPSETSVVRLNDGRLFSVFRTEGAASVTYSSDDGKTWTKPVDLYAIGGLGPKGGICGVEPRLLLLSNGVLALASGGGHNDYPGRQLWIAFSLDGKGERWTHHALIGDPTKPNHTSYPDIVEVEPGKLLYVYDEDSSNELWCVPIEVRLKGD